jgi:hypothetical protein
LENLAQKGEVCAAAHGDDSLDSLSDADLEASGRLGISSLAFDNPSELQVIAGRQNQMASLCRRTPSRQMLRGNVVAPRNLGNNGARNERLCDNLRLLFVAPASPPAACENLKARKPSCCTIWSTIYSKIDGTFGSYAAGPRKVVQKHRSLSEGWRD